MPRAGARKWQRLSATGGQYALRAERRMGELLMATAVTGERAGRGGDRKSKSSGATLKLSDLDVSKNESSSAQRLAALPEEVFEQIVTGEKTKGDVQRDLRRADLRIGTGARSRWAAADQTQRAKHPGLQRSIHRNRGEPAGENKPPRPGGPGPAGARRLARVETRSPPGPSPPQGRTAPGRACQGGRQKFSPRAAGSGGPASPRCAPYFLPDHPSDRATRGVSAVLSCMAPTSNSDAGHRWLAPSASPG